MDHLSRPLNAASLSLPVVGRSGHRCCSLPPLDHGSIDTMLSGKGSAELADFTWGTAYLWAVVRNLAGPVFQERLGSSVPSLFQQVIGQCEDAVEIEVVCQLGNFCLVGGKGNGP